MQWNELFSALALVMIIEGILPFLNPEGFKRYLQSMQDLEASSIRKVGAGLMIAGLIALYMIRQGS